MVTNVGGGEWSSSLSLSINPRSCAFQLPMPASQCELLESRPRA